MQEIRDRARANLPTVLLTLLSIVQALALEFLWSHIRETSSLFEASWLSMLMWVQIAACFIGLVLIWVVYASHVMRLRWVPTTTDSVYPFAIGVLEFTLVELLGPTNMGLWLICYAAVFALMVWISHRTMRRARQDESNSAFFGKLEPATPKDFLSGIIMIAAMAGAGLYIKFSNDMGVFTLIALLLTACLAIFQFWVAAQFWERSLSDDWPQKPK